MFDHLFHVTPPEVDHEKVLDNTIVLKGKDGRYLEQNTQCDDCVHRNSLKRVEVKEIKHAKK